MIPELGHFALILPSSSPGARHLPLVGAHRNRHAWVAVARPAARAMALLITFSFACLTRPSSATTSRWCYCRPAFQLAAAHGIPGRRRLGRPRGFAAAVDADAFLVGAGGHHFFPPTAGNHGGPRARYPGAGGGGLLLFILITSNRSGNASCRAPREAATSTPLQDFGLVIHPPLLYMGCRRLSVAFSSPSPPCSPGQLDAAWARWSRPWTLAAWIFSHPGDRHGFVVGLLRTRLGRLVVLGSRGKRLVHAVAGGHRPGPVWRSRKTGSSRTGPYSLAISPFPLAARYLPRPFRVLTSVHAFATDLGAAFSSSSSWRR